MSPPEIPIPYLSLIAGLGFGGVGYLIWMFFDGGPK